VVLYSVLFVSLRCTLSINLPWSNVRGSRIRDHIRDKDIRGLEKYVSLSNVVPDPSNSKNKVARILPSGIARVLSRRRSTISKTFHIIVENRGTYTSFKDPLSGMTT